MALSDTWQKNGSSIKIRWPQLPAPRIGWSILVLAIHFMRLPTLGFGSDVRFQSGQGCPAIGFGTAWLNRRAATRSRITLRSNSAMPAMIVNIALPLGVGVTHCFLAGTRIWAATRPPPHRVFDLVTKSPGYRRCQPAVHHRCRAVYNTPPRSGCQMVDSGCPLASTKPLCWAFLEYTYFLLVYSRPQGVPLLQPATRPAWRFSS